LRELHALPSVKIRVSVDSWWLDESSFIAITSMVVGVENDDIRRDWWRIANLREYSTRAMQASCPRRLPKIETGDECLKPALASSHIAG